MAGALEIAAASLEDSLINSMSFHGRSTASYIISRRSTAYVPQSGDTFSPANTRIIRFSLNDSDGSWLDGSSIRLGFNFHNRCNADMQPTCCSPASLFRRLRVLLGGVEVFDSLYHGRTHELFSLLLSPSRRMNDAIEGWGAQLVGATLEDHLSPRRSRKERHVECYVSFCAAFSVRASVFR
jgi:hypothetical protein